MNNPSKEEMMRVITEKCKAANPEIMELKFGCKIIDSHNKERIILQCSDDKTWAQTCGSDYEDVFCESICEILGREIGLADVILLIQNMNFEDVYVNTVMRFIADWNLLKPLSGQELETITFIHNLLV